MVSPWATASARRLRTTTPAPCPETKPVASAAKVRLSGEPGAPVVENSTQSTSSFSYSLNTSGKCTSMPRAHPNRTPSTSKTLGVEPGAYMYVIFVFDSRRSS